MTNAFYLADMITNSQVATNINSQELENIKPPANTKLSKYTIFSMATIDWLMNYRHSSKQLMHVLHKHYITHDNKGPEIYGRGFASWLSLGAPWYRTDYEGTVAVWASIVGHTVPNMRELKRVVSKISRATNNTLPALKSAEMITTTVYHLKKKMSKANIMKYLEKNYGYIVCSSLDEYIKQFAFTTNAYRTTEAALNCFFLTNSFKEAIKKVLQYKYNTDLICCIVSILAEACYNDVPRELISRYYALLPEDYKDLISKYNKFKYNNSNHSI